VRLLRISHSWWFGEGVTGRGKTTRHRVQGKTRLDRHRKPEVPEAKASGSAEPWRSEVDYGFIYLDREVVIGVTATGYCNAIRPRMGSMNIFQRSFVNVRGRARFGEEMSTTWQQYDRNFGGRQQRSEKPQGYELVLIFTWLGALLSCGFLWWAAFRLLFCMVQLIRYAPGFLP
jgi:hypothetical protein